MRRQHEFAGAALLAMFVMANVARANDPAPAEDGPPQKLEFESFMTRAHEIPNVPYQIGNYRGKISLRTSDKPGELTYEYEWQNSGYVILPILGAIYQAEKVNALDSGATALTVHRVTDKELLKEVGVDRKSVPILIDSWIAFDFANGGQDRMRVGYNGRVEGVERREKPRVKLRVERTIGPHRAGDRGAVDWKDIEVPVGGTFAAGTKTFAVVKVIAADQVRNILGWVELTEKPVSKDAGK